MTVESRSDSGDRLPRGRSRSPFHEAVGAVLELIGVKTPGGGHTPEERIKVLLEEGAWAGAFGEAEHAMVRRVFRLGRQRAGVLMTPMKEVVWLDVADPPDLMRRKITGSPHSRFPVCAGGIDDILGVVDVKDLLIQSFTGKPFSIKGLLKLPLFLYEGTPGLKVLEMFKTTGTHIAVVLSEYGSVVGLLTLNDILKAIIGEMPTDADPVDPKAVRRDDGSWLLNGMMTVDEFKDAVGGTSLPEGDYRTLAGFLVSRLGHIPEVSERCEWGGYRFEVAEMDGHRVDSVVVTSLRGDR